MFNEAQTELDVFLESVKRYFGNNLKSVIVYGSYARGDYNENSDIDIMILVGLTDEEIKKTERVV